jgi:hypothetical protein
MTGSPASREFNEEDAFKAAALRIAGWSYSQIRFNMALDSQATAYELVKQGLALPKREGDHERWMHIVRSNRPMPMRRMTKKSAQRARSMRPSVA